jgi:hypothetical protein
MYDPGTTLPEARYFAESVSIFGKFKSMTACGSFAVNGSLVQLATADRKASLKPTGKWEQIPPCILQRIPGYLPGSIPAAIQAGVRCRLAS